MKILNNQKKCLKIYFGTEKSLFTGTYKYVTWKNNYKIYFNLLPLSLKLKCPTCLVYTNAPALCGAFSHLI